MSLIRMEHLPERSAPYNMRMPPGTYRMHSKPLSTDEFLDQVYGAGSDYRPEMLWTAYREGLITNDTIAEVIGRIWNDSDHPDDPYQMYSVTHERWAHMFIEAGYTRGGKRAERPTEAIRVYRGTAWPRRRLWSWTTDLATARRFANGVDRREIGEVWTTLAPPRSLLAWNTQENAREDEVIVNTDGLRITRLKPSRS